MCVPVPELEAAPEGTWELPGGTGAQTVHRGPCFDEWDDLWAAHTTLAAWICRHGYEVAGPLREVYLVDERDTADPAQYVTQLTWPVRRGSH